MATAEGSAEMAASAPKPTEPLACTGCRTRKLRCNRVKPACDRCARLKMDCVYPESRRKPAFKRKNVRELEARLAQVEDMLKDAGKGNVTTSTDANLFGSPSAVLDAGSFDFDFDQSNVDINMDTADEGETLSGNATSLPEPTAFPFQSGTSYPPNGPDPSAQTSAQELMNQGLYEQLPPFEIIEDLHTAFFSMQHPFIPIIHEARYLKAFYSPPHMKPPMCLQYAIWAMAANGHEKYTPFHDIFYKRARRYAEDDETKGYGEHFMTLSHAQAWALIATYEARCMHFTKVAMSSARCVRLVEMMSLHRLDEGDEERMPILSEPTCWIEKEERRRTFWGVYCIDSHASISTGWPSMIQHDEITTHLPSSEEAFQQGTEENTCLIQDVFTGSSYSTFAGGIVICHLFNRMLKHVYKSKASDRPDDYEYGQFWKTHRELDNMLSSVFMFLPERFRLPENLRDPVAVHTNLNLHASVICLHHAASEKVTAHSLPDYIKKSSQDRLVTAAQEVVNIMRMTSHISTGYRSPLVALSLYCAASVYIYQAKDAAHVPPLENLEFLIACMESIGREHIITRAFLQQLLADLTHSGLAESVRHPEVDPDSFPFTPCSIPLLARSAVSRHTRVQPPLPGRLPLDNPIGRCFLSARNGHAGPALPIGIARVRELAQSRERELERDQARHAAKRTCMTHRGVAPFIRAVTAIPGGYCMSAALNGASVRLPHRTGSPASLSTSSQGQSRTTPGTSIPTPSVRETAADDAAGSRADVETVGGGSADGGGIDDMGAAAAGWGLGDGSFASPMTEMLRTAGQFDADSWTLLNTMDGADGVWDMGDGAEGSGNGG